MLYSTKDSSAEVQYVIDWRLDLGDGDTIAAVAFEPPAALTMLGTMAITGTTTVIRLAGGRPGAVHVLEFLIITSGGRMCSQAVTLTMAAAL